MIIYADWIHVLQITLNITVGLLFLLVVLTLVPRYAHVIGGPYTLTCSAIAGGAAGFYHLQLAYFLLTLPGDTSGGYQWTYAALFMNLQLAFALLLLNGLMIGQIIKSFKGRGRE